MLLTQGANFGASRNRLSAAWAVLKEWAVSPAVALVCGFTVWLVPAVAPVLYIWRSRRDLSVAVFFLVLQFVFGLYTWKFSAQYQRERVTWFKSKHS